MPEWDRIAPYYDQLFANRTVDIPFWLTIAKRFGSPMLELGAGTGRVTLALARAGVKITGIDVSAPMLGQARKKLVAEPASVQKRVNLFQGDACTFFLPGKIFKVVFSPWGFPPVTTSQQQGLLGVTRKHLDLDGLFVIDCFNYQEPRGDGESSQMLATKHFPRYTLVRRAHSLTKASQKLIEISYTLDILPTSGKAKQIVTRRIERMYTRADFEQLLIGAGFRITELYGDYDFSRWSKGSPRTILLATTRP